jgi:dihydrofolate reductase
MERGGWARPLFDDEALASVNEFYQRADAFLFGRRTYEIFAGYWGVMDSGLPAHRAPAVRRDTEEVHRGGTKR